MWSLTPDPRWIEGLLRTSFALATYFCSFDRISRLVIQNNEVDRVGLGFNIRFAEPCYDFVEASQITGHGWDRAGTFVAG